MNRDSRIEKIQEVVNREPFMIQEIPWQGKLEAMNVYKIPLDLLVYNKYNGRILSRTKSLENQKQKIDAESDGGKELIAKLLWDSKPDRNKKTLKNIYDFEQQKVGIITKDGIIIDGNRRVMLLNEILKDPKYTKKYNYFKAVVLPVTSEENPIEIEELETKFQMGEDEKLGYNATEKYLKAKEIYLRLTKSSQIILSDLNDEAIKKISDWMGEPNSEIRKYMNTMVLMDEYLNYLEYDGIYTRLDKGEDQFLSLTKWLNTFYDSQSRKGFDGYDDTDVDDLKTIAFDFIRLRGTTGKGNYDGKEFRNLAEGNNDKHFFGNKDIWKKFSSEHFNILNKIPEEPEIDFNSNNLDSHLSRRDNDYYKTSKFGKEESEFIENLNERKTDIGYNKASGEPKKLVQNASRAFDAIKTGHSSFAKPEVQKLVEELGTKVISSLKEKSPSKVLDHIINLLESIDIDKIPDSEVEKVKSISKKISSYCYHNFDKGL